MGHMVLRVRNSPARHDDSEQPALPTCLPHPFTIDPSAQTRCHSISQFHSSVHPRAAHCGGGIILLICLLVLALLIPPLAALGAEPALTDPRTLTFNPIQFVPPEPARVVLKNGLV